MSRAEDRFSEDLAPFVLGALPEDERRAVEEHLLDCDTCRREVGELRLAVDVLPLTVPSVAPPPGLKSSVMAVVESEAALLAAAGERADRPEAPERERRSGLSWGWLRRPLPVAGALACVLAAVFFAGYALRGNDDVPDARIVAAQVAPEGAAVSLRVEDGHGTLQVRDMPQPPGGEVWQMWLKRKGREPQPTPALFTTSNGSVSVPGDLDGVDEVLVTSEPQNGSARPTSQPVVVASTA